MDNSKKIAIFWDKSFLWGLIAYDTFQRLEVDFELLSAEDIRGGGLAGHELLFVPGGWASDKIVALGDSGREAIRDFVAGGGSYLGFCGGAGLALSHESALGLVSFGRVPTDNRLPSFSGRIELRHLEAGHPMWNGIDDYSAFHAWWPGQFAIDDSAGVRVLASYAEPQADSYVTDLPIGSTGDWKKWEDAYGINLDPGRIIGEPAVVEARFGDGRVMLSYLHFETPDDAAGNIVLLNLLSYLAPGSSRRTRGNELPGGPGVFAAEAGGTGDHGTVAEGDSGKGRPVTISRVLSEAAEAFVEFGARNFLWYRRSEWLLQWRRGVRGIEYSTLAAMLGQIARLAPAGNTEDAALLEKLLALQVLVMPFLDGARQLIMLERFAMLGGPISPLKTADPDIAALREHLFSTTKRCGGEYEQIIELADRILLPLLRREMATPPTT